MRSDANARMQLTVFFLLLSSAAFARTPGEVACEEDKLGRLAHRMAFDSEGSNLFVWAVEGDQFSGLAVLPRFTSGIRDEHQMGFNLFLHSDASLLNPRRPLLPQAVLVRNDLLTTPFRPPTEDPRIDVSLELAPEVVDPQIPTQGILISSQAGTPTGSASGAGRALVAEDLFERCPGAENSAFDFQVFEILSRTLRIAPDLMVPFPGRVFARYKTILFRDVEPLTYRAKVISYYTVFQDGEDEYGEASFQLRVRLPLDADGRFAPGSIEVLPWCHAGAPPPCTDLLNPDTAVVVAPPIFAGHEFQTGAQYLSGAFLNIPFEDSPDNILTAVVPWPELLRGTAWERPIGVP